MNTKLTTLAAAGLLSLSAAAPALAGSVTQPGETVGVAAGAPLSPGLYYLNTTDWWLQEHATSDHVCRGHDPGGSMVDPRDPFGREAAVPGGNARGVGGR
jgi:hypothetical protein